MNGGRGRGVCYDFQRGQCFRGDGCRFERVGGGANMGCVPVQGSNYPAPGGGYGGGRRSY